MTTPAADTPRVRAPVRAQMWRLSLAALLVYTSYAMCRSPLVPLYAQRLGATASEIGLIMSASTMMGAALKLPAGLLSDVAGRGPLLWTGAGIFGVTPFAYLAVAGAPLLFLVRLFHGTATAIFGPVAAATISDLAPVAARATWLGAYATAQSAGQALGPVLAGYLIARDRFDSTFLISGIVGIAGAAALAGARTSTDTVPTGHGTRAIREGLREVCADRLLLATSGAQAAHFMLKGALLAFLPLFGRDVLGLSASQIGWIFAAQAATTIAARPAMGVLSDRAGRRGPIAGGLILCGAGVWSVPAAGSAAELMAAVSVFAAGAAVTAAAASAYVTDLARGGRFGAAHGAFGTIYDIGDMMGPLGAGLLIPALGYTRTFRCLAMVAIAAAAGFIAIASRRCPLPAR